MLVEIDLLDYLAYQMGCGILSDLRLFQQSERLHAANRNGWMRHSI